MHYKMLVESKILPLECCFSVILIFLLFLCKISWFLILISFVRNFLSMDVLLKTYLLYFLPIPYTHAAEFRKKIVDSSFF